MGSYFKLAVVALSLLGAGARHSEVTPRGTQSIDWKPCGNNKLIECGFYVVPLDYADSTAGNATLAVSRYKSTTQPRLGTLFTNPGGPGGSGTSFIQGGDGELISSITQGHYDIVSWDPRGVNLSTPSINCGFHSAETLSSFWNNTIPGVGVEARGNFTDQNDIDNFYSRLNETDAKIVEFGNQCMQSDGAFLKYMGTAAVVRDMVSLSEYLEGPNTKINYWGFSYGTVIGNYFVNMFPDRVGRVIIDGVVETTVYATEQSYKLWQKTVASVDATLAGFTQACAQAGPQGCALAEKGSTSASIEQELWNMINTAYDLGKAGVDVSSVDVRFAIWQPLYTPNAWVGFAETLKGMAGDLANAADSLSSPSNKRGIWRRDDGGNSANGADPLNESMSGYAIACLDSIDQDEVTTKDVFDELLRVTHEESPIFGELMNKATVGGFFCHRFPVRAVERFTGPFNHTPAYPIMVIGNEADPVTPFANAKSVAAQYGSNAYLIEQDDFGHASIAERSDCTQGAIRDYLLQGTLPTEGKFCGTNQVLFPGPGVTKGTMDAASDAGSELDDTDSDPGSHSDSGSNDSQVSKLTKERNIITAVAGALGLASLILAGTLAFTCIRNRKNTRYAPPSAAAALLSKYETAGGRRSMEAGEQLYSEPWEGRKTAY